MRRSRLSLLGAAAAGVLVLGSSLMAAGAASAVATPSLTGHLDSVTRVAMGEIKVTGWAADTGALGAPVRMAVYIDGAGHGFGAALARPDVQAHLHAPQNEFGFSASLLVAGGTHHVCVYALAIDGRTNKQLGCRAVTLPVDPIGHIDSIVVQPGWPEETVPGPPLIITGWAFDPDVRGGPGEVSAYTYFLPAGERPREIDTFVTSIPRPDVAKAYGLSNDMVGFSVEMSTSFQSLDHRNFYTINIAGAGTNRFIG